MSTQHTIQGTLLAKLGRHEEVERGQWSDHFNLSRPVKGEGGAGGYLGKEGRCKGPEAENKFAT